MSYSNLNLNHKFFYILYLNVIIVYLIIYVYIILYYVFKSHVALNFFIIISP